MSIFKTMGSILNNQEPDKEEIEKIPSYVMLKWLSNNKFTVIPANIINLNYNIPIYNQYRFLKDYCTLSGINKRVKFIKYPKKEMQESLAIKNISLYYNINTLQAKKYAQLMDKKELKKFEELYNEGKI